jgi:hypothetical protein
VYEKRGAMNSIQKALKKRFFTVLGWFLSRQNNQNMNKISNKAGNIPVFVRFPYVKTSDIDRS